MRSFSVVGLVLGLVGGLVGGALSTGCSPRRSAQAQHEAAAPASPAASSSPGSPSGATARPRLALPRTSREAPRPLTRVAPERLLQAVTPPPGPPPGAPLSLTTSDGTGLVLQSLKASAVVSGPLAFTELHLVFDNPDSRVLEGRFEIALPPGAAISRFAMLMPDGWREAEVVERQRARAAYEDFLHRRQDPALLEREAGNRFSARVFPIPPRGRKELKLSYSQELADTSRAYRLPLHGLPRLGRLEIVAINLGHGQGQGPGGDEVTQVIKQDVVPEQDFEIRPALRGAGGVAGLRSDRLAVARIKIGGEQPALALAAEQPLDKVLLLVDTSASRALGFAQQLELLAALIESIRQASPQATLQVAAFDQSVAPVFSGPIGELTAQKLAALSQRGPLGASDLEGALRYAQGQKAARIVLITDGITTAQGGAGEQRAAAAALGPSRLDVILVGGIRDEVAMRALATALPRTGLVLDGTEPAARLVERLRQPVLAGLKVAVAGARWHWPTELSGVQPGDERLIYAELADGEPGQSLRVTLRGAPGGPELLSDVPLHGVSAPLLERAYVQARIAELTHEHEQLLASDKQAAAALRKDLVELSTRHRVLSDFTALLVLETEQDYARFQLDRRALADILTVGERGIELLQRRQEEPAARPGALVPVEVQVRHTSHALRVQGTEPAPADPSAPAPTAEGDGSAEESARRGARAAMEQSRQSGILSLLARGDTASSFGRDSALGRPDEALGELVGDEISDSFGAGGLGLVGTGQGGGGTGQGGGGTVRRGGQRRGVRGPRPRPTEIALGASEVSGGLDPEIIRRIVRRHLGEVHFCYERELARSPQLEGRVRIAFTIAPTGMVSASSVQGATEGLEPVAQCLAGAVRRWGFPQPRNGVAVEVGYPFELKQGPAAAPSEPDDADDTADEDDSKHPSVPPYTGTLLEVMTQLGRGRTAEALRLARAWRQREPGDVLALTALGAALTASGDTAGAERAYGSLIDLFPSRADLRRFAGSHLEALRSAGGLRLAIDTYKKSAEQRPDHPSSHRLYGYALARAGRLAEAFAALRTGLTQRYPDGRFLGVEQVLREDLGILGAAWQRAEPARAAEIQGALTQAGVAMASEPSLRFVLTWETDANDVDFHIYDGQRGHAWFSNRKLRSGGELYADVTTGYGPECFAIRGRASAFPYRLKAHYYSRGPMGYGMGKLQILAHDGKGGLRFEDRPFVIMNDDAYVDLGRLNRPL